MERTIDFSNQALSDFADFVEKQQALRYPSAKPPAAAGASGASQEEHHEELDILDELDFNSSEPRVPLRDLLLAPDDDEAAQTKLSEVIAERLEEGHGEAVFDLGFENHGDTMRLTREEWDAALARLVATAKKSNADCDVLLTKGVGGKAEAESTANGKETKDCTGKVLIRQAPATVENVIETRIAVVGNGKATISLSVTWDYANGPSKSTLVRALCSEF